jgi:hypothetical protein
MALEDGWPNNPPTALYYTRPDIRCWKLLSTVLWGLTSDHKGFAGVIEFMARTLNEM